MEAPSSEKGKKKKKGTQNWEEPEGQCDKLEMDVCPWKVQKEPMRWINGNMHIVILAIYRCPTMWISCKKKIKNLWKYLLRDYRREQIPHWALLLWKDLTAITTSWDKTWDSDTHSCCRSYVISVWYSTSTFFSCYHHINRRFRWTHKTWADK